MVNITVKLWKVHHIQLPHSLKNPIHRPLKSQFLARCPDLPVSHSICPGNELTTQYRIYKKPLKYLAFTAARIFFIFVMPERSAISLPECHITH